MRLARDQRLYKQNDVLGDQADMKFGIILTTGSPRELATMASEAEATGWDAAFYWDGISLGSGDIFDPWVVMAAIATATTTLRFGAIVTPPARRRPWKLAREAITLDHLSNGRLILPVGLGALDDGAFGNVGEPTDARTRAERLDESLAILDGLWSGQPFGFKGRHYAFGPMTFRPQPVQRPRVPIWVAATMRSQRSLRRAALWDGVLPQTNDPTQIREVVEFGLRMRTKDQGDRPWDVVVEGTTPADDREASAAIVRPVHQAGATWWIEADWTTQSVDRIRARLAAGPPRP
jgi:alkanesulfonate monooxygenase SsuD/methylene tetrahydromethanopterin reductase-like flavin-dependent oxidoreductase (luciferase family)